MIVHAKRACDSSVYTTKQGRTENYQKCYRRREKQAEQVWNQLPFARLGGHKSEPLRGDAGVFLQGCDDDRERHFSQ